MYVNAMKGFLSRRKRNNRLNKHRLEILLYHNSRTSYHILLDITGCLKSAAVDTSGDFVQDRKFKESADVKPIECPSKKKANSGCRIGFLLCVLLVFCETLPELLKSNKMLQNF